MGLLPTYAPPANLQNLYFNTPMPASSGSISTYHPTLGERVTNFVERRARKAGLSKSMAAKIGTLPDFTPIGAMTTAYDLGGDLRQGRYGSALVNGIGTGLNAIPEVGGPAKAMFLGVMAKGADKAALRKAKGMFAKGGNEWDIWQQTGWAKGAEGKWRFEINDRPMQTKKLYGMDGETLSDAIDHPKLFEAYPQLANYEVMLGHDRGGGQFRPSDKLFIVPPASHDHADRSVLAHEVQHAIQEIEGFARGGQGGWSNPNYVNLAGEVEARAVQDRLGWGDEARRKYHPSYSMDVKPQDQIVSLRGGAVNKR